MPKYRVIIEVDGERHEEEVNAPDCKLGMSKALKLHPVKVLAITPLDEQLDLDRDHHPGQTTVPATPEEIAAREEDVLGEPWEPEAPEADTDDPPIAGDDNDAPSTGLEIEPIDDNDVPDLMGALKASMEPDQSADEVAVLERESFTPDPSALEAELAAMRGPDGTDESGLDS